ncbi:MAG: hypothetical protein ABIW79_01505 [Gemmatimonas sp.]
MIRTRVLLVTLLVSGSGTACHRPARPALAATARIPRDAARFEIESVNDSTATFRPFEATWLVPGMSIHAVDPARRDALVARLRIVRADSGRLTALVTSQVTRVTTEHFVLAIKPRTTWYRERRFWWGFVGGGVAGAAGAMIAR